MFTKCNLHDLFIPGFPALMESFYVQEKLMNKYAYKILVQFVSILSLIFNSVIIINFITYCIFYLFI